MVSIKNASYSKGKSIIKDFTLSFKQGDRICLKGSSGIGKTTILKIIAGLHSGYEGEINIGSINIAYAPQSTGLLPWKKVISNTMLLRRGNKNRAEALELLTRLGLEGLEKRYPLQLSGGQRQRVGLAQVLYSRPDILLLDESFSALDGDTKENALQLLDEYLKTSNATLILVSHTDHEGEWLNCKFVEVGK